MAQNVATAPPPYAYVTYLLLGSLPRVALRWLHWIFGGWYLPTLSIKYVGMIKDMEKRLPKLYYIKMTISFDLGFIEMKPRSQSLSFS